MSYDRGSLWTAEIAGQRKRTLIVSSVVFSRRYGRVLLAPDAGAEADEPRRPGWVGVPAAYFDVTKITSLPVDRLLDHLGSAAAPVATQARRIVDEALR